MECLCGRGTVDFVRCHVSATKWTVARGEWARKDEDKADDD